MHFKKILIFGLLLPLFIFSGQYFQYYGDLPDFEPEQGSVEYNLVVKMIGDEWRVVFQDDESKSDVTLKRGDRIRWTVEGSDASFTFPDRRIFGDKTKNVKAGKSIVLPVTPKCPEGTYEYSVYISASKTYARGQSPPRIIVRNR